jgi:tryptophanyl-tRNA synthetase
MLSGDMMKKTILSGSTATGDLTIGNYIGAISNWKMLQEEYDCFYMVADLHALTVKQDPQQLRQRRLSFFAQYIALGLDPEKNVLFMQSDVHAHTELSWILTCLTPMGFLNRMTQFKDKSAQHSKNINAGLYTYPILMAADILLYQADLVPVGEDQKQHLELCRDIVGFFDHHYQEGILKMPEPFIGKSGARIMSLQEPSKKMSKSDPNPKSFVSILDPLKKIQKKIKGAVTDSGTEIIYDPENRPGISNLLTIYSAFSGKDVEELVREYEGKMYGHLKVDLADLVCSTLAPVQERYQQLMDDWSELERLMQKGAEVAAQRANQTVEQVYAAVGLR